MLWTPFARSRSRAKPQKTYFLAQLSQSAVPAWPVQDHMVALLLTRPSSGDDWCAHLRRRARDSSRHSLFLGPPGILCRKVTFLKAGGVKWKDSQKPCRRAAKASLKIYSSGAVRHILMRCQGTLREFIDHVRRKCSRSRTQCIINTPLVRPVEGDEWGWE